MIRGHDDADTVMVVVVVLDSVDDVVEELSVREVQAVILSSTLTRFVLLVYRTSEIRRCDGRYSWKKSTH